MGLSQEGRGKEGGEKGEAAALISLGKRTRSATDRSERGLQTEFSNSSLSRQLLQMSMVLFYVELRFF